MSTISSCALPNRLQKGGLLCMRVFYRMKKVLELIDTDRPDPPARAPPPGSDHPGRCNPYQDETPSESP